MGRSHSFFISLLHGKLHCLKMGEGPAVLLCFHGYGNTSSLFERFTPFLRQKFTLLSVDLPHHGKSSWSKDRILEKADLIALVEFICEKFDVEKISLMGYSMGGRVCLVLAELLPSRMDRVVLIAPDGMVFNPLYYFAANTRLGRSLLKSFVLRPRTYLNTLEWLHEKQFIDQHQLRFAQYYTDSKADREMLWKVWPAMRTIIPNKKRLRAALKSFHFPVFIFVGAYDRVIKLEHARQFKKAIPEVDLIVLEKGHHVFDQVTLPQIAHSLLR